MLGCLGGFGSTLHALEERQAGHKIACGFLESSLLICSLQSGDVDASPTDSPPSLSQISCLRQNRQASLP